MGMGPSEKRYRFLARSGQQFLDQMTSPSPINKGREGEVTTLVPCRSMSCVYLSSKTKCILFWGGDMEIREHCSLQRLRGDAEELWDPSHFLPPPPQLGGVESMSLL